MAPAPSSPPVAAPRSPATYVPRAGPQAVSESAVPSLGQAARVVELFIQRQNERDANGCAAMLVADDDIRGPSSAYGAVGKDNIRNALAAWIELHLSLIHI